MHAEANAWHVAACRAYSLWLNQNASSIVASVYTCMHLGLPIQPVRSQTTTANLSAELGAARRHRASLHASVSACVLNRPSKLFSLLGLNDTDLGMLPGWLAYQTSRCMSVPMPCRVCVHRGYHPPTGTFLPSQLVCTAACATQPTRGWGSVCCMLQLYAWTTLTRVACTLSQASR